MNSWYASFFLTLAAILCIPECASAQSCRFLLDNCEPQGSPPAERPGGTTEIMLGRFGKWGAYTKVFSSGKVNCWALTRPGSISNESSDRRMVQITQSPSDNLWNEVAVFISYSFKKNSEAVLQIGSKTFPLWTQDFAAGAKGPGSEIVEAMRLGSELKVRGISDRGGAITDGYSLDGFAEAIESATKHCRSRLR
jgi:hypothetical protein